MKHNKNHKITVRLSDRELRSLKNRKVLFHKNHNIKLDHSKFVRHCLSKIDNLDFLVQIGFLSYLEYMDITLYKPKTRKTRRNK